ncbi:MAG: ABC transporter permease subunit [Candidatus Aminicenantes bacterium]|nr:ABC transporter permease subunit [Candidatus Aminicenantes bacterium]
MIWKIAKKEFFNNLLTFRFTFGTLILIFLVLAITLGSVSGFLNLREEFLLGTQANETKLSENRVFCTIEYEVTKAPEVLSILNLGVTNRLGNSVLLSLRQIPSAEKKYAQENPLLNIFTSLDLTLVYKIVISLLAMLFAFDAISGEKERGTLMLLIAQGVSRFKVILGKYFGNMMTLMATFLISLFIAFLIIILHFPNLKTVDWMRILLFALLTMFYMSLFFLFGLLISALTKKASHSLIFCLFVWIIFVIIIPNLSTYIATVIKPVPPEKTLEVQIDELYSQTQGKLRVWNDNNQASIRFSGSMDDTDGIYVLRRADRITIDHFKKLIAFSEPLYRERTDKIWAAKQDFYFKLRDQEKLATRLNRISPTGLFQEVSEMIARTDIPNYERYIQQAALFRESVFNYLEAKDAFKSLRFFTVMEEKDILPPEEYRKVNYRKPDGSSYTLEDYDPLNLSDFPRFSYQEETLPDIFPRVITLLFVLVLLNLIFFLGSAWAFYFYDVR